MRYLFSLPILVYQTPLSSFVCFFSNLVGLNGGMGRKQLQNFGPHMLHLKVDPTSLLPMIRISVSHECRQGTGSWWCRTWNSHRPQLSQSIQMCGQMKKEKHFTFYTVLMYSVLIRRDSYLKCHEPCRGSGGVCGPCWHCVREPGRSNCKNRK